MEVQVPVDLCNFCQDNEKRYTCPQCNSNYCSLTCFQSPQHAQCSETFYRTCVMEELANISGERPTDKSVVDALIRTNTADDGNEDDDSEDASLDSDDDPECRSLSDRLADVDLNDTKEVWARLTSDERQQFKAILRSNEVSKIIPKWQPWWVQNDHAKIREVKDDEECLDNSPPVIDDIKPLSSISSKSPSPCVQHNLTNIIAAYTFMVRYFNGCHFELLQEAVTCMVLLSLSLKNNANFETATLAIQSVQDECLKMEYITADLENFSLVNDDVQKIAAGLHKFDKSRYILSALSDVHRLFGAFLSDGKHGRSLRGGSINRSQIKMALKKIEYLLSYTCCYEK